MKKKIDKTHLQIIYEGGPEELKPQLEKIVEQMFHKSSVEISELNPKDEVLSNFYERVYYNKRRILYVPNTGKRLRRFIFEEMIKRSKLADGHFTRENPNYKIENLS